MNATIAVCPQCRTKNRIPAAKQHLHPRCGKCKAILSLAESAVPVELEDRTFADFIKQVDLPIMVDFFSPTCGPCHMLAPTIDALARKFVGRAVIAKIDTNRHQMTAARYQIGGVPTLLFFKNGRLADQVVGAVPEQQLVQKLNQLL
jgi:thioredoxin 2